MHHNEFVFVNLILKISPDTENDVMIFYVRFKYSQIFMQIFIKI